MSDPLLRDACRDDLAAIREIYNYYVLRSTCTYELKPETLEDRQRWFESHAEGGYAVVVAEIDHRVVGWGSLSKFHTRAGYDPSVEASVYVHHDFHRRGLGRTILQYLIQRARDAGYHTIIGGASADQTASIALQEGLGFRRVAHFKEVGQKFGRRLDVVYLQLML